MRILASHLLPDKPVAIHDAPDELRVLLHGLEVRAAPEDQRLRYGVLQPAVSLLGTPFSCALYELVLVAFRP